MLSSGNGAPENNRLFFKDSGWFRFWVAKTNLKAMVFRMPEQSTKSEVVERARAKLSARKIKGDFTLHEADEAAVVRWLMGHRKKALLGEYGNASS